MPETNGIIAHVPEVVTEAKPEPAESAGASVKADEYNQLKTQFMRLKAEFDNYQKRMKRDQENLRKFATEDLMKKLVTVVDDVDRALDAAKNTENVAALVDGVNIIRDHFWQLLAAEGLERIPTTGEVFDPEVHEAVSTEISAEIAENHVVSTYQAGYKLNSRVIRAAMVTVSKKS